MPDNILKLMEEITRLSKELGVTIKMSPMDFLGKSVNPDDTIRELELSEKLGVPIKIVK